MSGSVKGRSRWGRSKSDIGTVRQADSLEPTRSFDREAQLAGKQENMKKGERGAWVSIGAYLFLASLKLIVGYVSDSKALFADGLNNTTDIMASVAVLIGLRIARKPADADHPYGHYRAETIGSFIAACIMGFVGVDVLIDGVRSIFARNDVVPMPLAMWTALFSAGVMLFVYRFNRRLGNQINSSAVKAAAADNKSDALVSLGAFVGILGAQFGLTWLDPLTAVVVGLIILKTAYEIFRDAAHALTDGFHDAKRLQDLQTDIKRVPGVKSILDIKGRLHGSNLYIDAVIGVDPGLSVEESHKITDEIEQRLYAIEDVEHVLIHVEPVQNQQVPVPNER